MKTAPSNATVLNTTVLSNFAHVDRVELLPELPRLVTSDGSSTNSDFGTVERVVRPDSRVSPQGSGPERT